MRRHYQSPEDAPSRAPHLEFLLDENDEATPRNHLSWRGVIGMGAAILFIGAVIVPLALALVSARSSTNPKAKVGPGPAQHRVLSALSATIDSGSFDMTYSDLPPTAPSTPPRPCPR